MRKITIAIDGYVATGKGTTAQRVAEYFGYQFLDTGAMRRAATLYASRHNLLDASDSEKTAMISSMQMNFQLNTHTNHYDMYLGDENVEQEIRSTELAMQMKPIVTCLLLRMEMVKVQQAFWTHGWIVADGRDIGTTVFPDAELKVFMVCDLETRVQRRYEQLIAQGLSADKEFIRQEIERRDQTDYLGPNAVNVKASDAIILDTTAITINEQTAKIIEWATEILEK